MLVYIPKVDIFKELGKNIRSIRKQRGLTQEELGIKAGVDPKYIGEIERGKANITIRTLLNISEVLETTVGELLLFTLVKKESLEIQEDAIKIVKILKRLKKEDRGSLVNILKAIISIVEEVKFSI